MKASTYTNEELISILVLRIENTTFMRMAEILNRSEYAVRKKHGEMTQNKDRFKDIFLAVETRAKDYKKKNIEYWNFKLSKCWKK